MNVPKNFSRTEVIVAYLERRCKEEVEGEYLHVCRCIALLPILGTGLRLCPQGGTKSMLYYEYTK